MDYKEAEKYLNDIKNKDEMLFRMAISHLMDVGIRHLTEEMVEQTCDEIMQQKEKNPFLSKEWQCEIVRTAEKLTKVNHIMLLVYIGKNLKYNV